MSGCDLQYSNIGRGVVREQAPPERLPLRTANLRLMIQLVLPVSVPNLVEDRGGGVKQSEQW
jgi:hypothetical protein